MPLDKKSLATSLKFVGAGAGLLVLFGFVLPYLISSDSNELVYLGAGIIATLITYLIYNGINKLQ